MKLDINSTSAQLYRWFYTKFEMPESLCPYFWKLAIMWTFILPYTVIALPALLFSGAIGYKTGERLGFGLFLWATAFAVFIIIFPITYLFWGWFPKDTVLQGFQVSGVFLDLVLVMASAVLGIIYLFKKITDRKYRRQKEMIMENGEWVPNPNYRTKRTNIIVEFIKASYNKYCPKIDWNYGVREGNEAVDND